MSTQYKVLGQINPVANITTNLYVVPSFYNSIISSLLICNQSSSNATITIAAQPQGNTLTNKHYLVYRANIFGNDTTPFTIGITLGPRDVLSANASSSNISITAFGMETDSISP
jgi:hypothetical protein